jgi:hypothetical protein
MGPPGNRFIRGGHESADNFSLTDSPVDQTGPGTSNEAAERNEDERQDYRQEPAEMNGGEHPRTKTSIAGGEEIAPVKTGRNEDESEGDRNYVPNDHPALEAGNDITGQGRKKQFHP